MKRLTSLIAAAGVAAAAFSPLPSQAGPVRVLDEGFSNLAGLSNWERHNYSLPAGTGWFQGNPDIFGAQSGPASSYAAANYLGAIDGLGVVDNWLITPTLNLSGLTTLSFFTNRAGTPGFLDLLEVRFSSGSGTDTEGFERVLATISGADFAANWQQWSASLSVEGQGRFAFRYYGDASTLDYIGLDTVSVVTAAPIPEPSSWLLLAGGAGVLALARRRRLAK